MTTPMLKRLGSPHQWAGDGRVFSARLSDDKTHLVLREECDGYFSDELTKAEAQQLVDELQALVNTMEN